MIPNVYMAWCQRKAICPWCNKDIEKSQPEVVVFYWRKGDETNRGFNVRKYYHPECWLGQGLDYLKMNPYRQVHSEGRKSHLDLSDGDRIKRRKLLAKKASLEQSKRRLTTPWPDSLIKEAVIDEKIAGVMVEIITVGGIPESWLENLIAPTR